MWVKGVEHQSQLWLRQSCDSIIYLQCLNLDSTRLLYRVRREDFGWNLTYTHVGSWRLQPTQGEDYDLAWPCGQGLS